MYGLELLKQRRQGVEYYSSDRLFHEITNLMAGLAKEGKAAQCGDEEADGPEEGGEVVIGGHPL